MKEKINLKGLNIVIISRTFFPAQFPRALRTTELAIELAKRGHNVTVFSVLGNYNYSQFSIDTNVKVKDIGKMFFATLDSDEKENNKILNKIFKRVFSFIDFPDIEFVPKVYKIFNKIKDIDLVISIAKPHTIHLGCAISKYLLSKSFPKLWIADCGDPYTLNPVNKQSNIVLKQFEKFTFKYADFITIPHEKSVNGYYKEFHHKIKIISQGFRFPKNKLVKVVDNVIPNFAYSGIFYKDFRDPRKFLDFLCEIEIDFKFHVFTRDFKLLKGYEIKLGNKLIINEYVPRDQLLKLLSQMDFLVNFENSSNLQSPSKLIDYAIVNRPILSINPHNFSENIFFDFLKGNFNSQLIIDIEEYKIENVVDKFLKLKL